MNEPRFDPDKVPSPSYVVDLGYLHANALKLKEVQDRTHCKILLALKGYACYSTFPFLKDYLAGICASSVSEALLGDEFFGKEVHAYSPAYSDQDIEELMPLVGHISFNSFSQWERYKKRFTNSQISCGLRINPEYSELKYPLYDPSGMGSRLGITLEHFQGKDLQGLEGLHFHSLCEQNSDTLERTLEVLEKKFGPALFQMKWVNFGGGHHITREDYDIDRLCRIITSFQEKYQVQVYLEPGEAVGLNTGYLVGTVLDILENKGKVAMLDLSATCHMPDVLEMPYRPHLYGADHPGIKAHTYRLGGLSCLAGDMIGDYSFDHPLQIGDKLVFDDMAHYTMVKTTTFNGVRLPAITIFDPASSSIQVVKEFGYLEYKSRLS
jgi:carboxynorspermidine decarboxylase